MCVCVCGGGGGGKPPTLHLHYPSMKNGGLITAAYVLMIPMGRGDPF